VAKQLARERLVLLANIVMAVITAPFPDPFHRPCEALSHRLPHEHPVSFSRLVPVMSKAEKIERRRSWWLCGPGQLTPKSKVSAHVERLEALGLSAADALKKSRDSSMLTSGSSTTVASSRLCSIEI